MREAISETIDKLIRWYDIAALAGIFVLVAVVSAITGETTVPNLLDTLAASLIIFGLIYVFIGLFGAAVFDVEQMSDEAILDGHG
ncbi:hypothetical protein [Halorubrum halodurans]|uniref:Uncharacterized protein n=1 Tax=Halorubrum halodurans TaxID=1383851 RepID=A0A256IKX4_9EURY|nr:hypothetical protein [Halorubrum halodurans]OYR57171.1 hypothetical protein DJ70_06460 [Halorubrum halodurans]